MNLPVIFKSLAVIGGLTLASWVWVKRAPGPMATSAQPSLATKSGESSQLLPPIRPYDNSVQPGVGTESPAAGTPVRKLTAARGDGSRSFKPSATAEALDVVRLVPDQVLAKVNNEPIQLRHLTPVGSATEKELTRAQYDSRLKRAIEMELMFQAARAEGVGLTPAQQRRVECIAPIEQRQMYIQR